MLDCDLAISDSESESESTTGCAAAPEDEPAITGAGTLDTEGVGAVGAVPAVLSTVAVGGATLALVVTTLDGTTCSSEIESFDLFGVQ